MLNRIRQKISDLIKPSDNWKNQKELSEVTGKKDVSELGDLAERAKNTKIRSEYAKSNHNYPQSTNKKDNDAFEKAARKAKDVFDKSENISKNQGKTWYESDERKSIVRKAEAGKISIAEGFEYASNKNDFHILALSIANNESVQRMVQNTPGSRRGPIVPSHLESTVRFDIGEMSNAYEAAKYLESRVKEASIDDKDKEEILNISKSIIESIEASGGERFDKAKEALEEVENTEETSNKESNSAGDAPSVDSSEYKLGFKRAVLEALGIEELERYSPADIRTQFDYYEQLDDNFEAPDNTYGTQYSTGYTPEEWSEALESVKSEDIKRNIRKIKKLTGKANSHRTDID